MGFHIHKWSEWNIKERGKIVNKYHQDNQVGNYILQERYCFKCLRTQISLNKTTLLADVVLKPDMKSTTPKHDKVK